MMTTDDLHAFFERGWNRHDVDPLIDLHGRGLCLRIHRGPRGVRHAPRRARARGRVFARVFEVFPDARFAEARHLVAGDRGLSEWRFTGTTVEGKANTRTP